MISNIYYHIRPLIPRRLQLFMRRMRAKKIKSSCSDTWPIDEKSCGAPGGWAGWPEDKKFALVLTHDVETMVGHDKCYELMKLEQELGFRSSFNFVPERYNVSSKLRNHLTDNGFEVGVHDLNHDGKLYKSKSIFKERAVRINDYLKQWNACGFRSGSMHRNLEWIQQLDLLYDASTFDTDPFEPNPDGVRTIFPFMLNNGVHKTGIVELPYTLPQDFTLFIIMKEMNIDIWKRKLDWIAVKGGMALMITHPDYMNFVGGRLRVDEYPVKYYEEFLDYVKTKYDDQCLNVVPREIAHFFKNNYIQTGDKNIFGNAQIKNTDIETKFSCNKRIWIDLDNSPHVPFFRPIIRELKNRGYSIAISTRDCSQTCGLADKYKLPYKKIGRHYGKSKIMKIIGLVLRSLQMIPFLIKEKPELAVSHGSRSQVFIAKLLGIKSISIFDYEHSKGLLFIQPDWFVVPEIVIQNNEHMEKSCFKGYPGIKEDVYVPEFNPDPAILKELNIDEEKLIVIIRPPATQAHYHNPEAEKLLRASINYIGQHENVCMILMPRYKQQKDFIRETWPEMCMNGKIIIPEQVVDGLNLMWHSDLVISGGGTMNREAAALHLPVYSIFRGKMGAVDRYLSDSGRLVFLETVEDIKTKINLVHRNKSTTANFEEKEALKRIVDIITEIAENELHRKGMK